jgi:hypothetical protein
MVASTKGYSTGFIDAVYEADNTKPGVQLALACMANNVPVMTVAKHFGVSRTTVYAWFKGESNAPRKHHAEMDRLIRELASK